ncbi:MAG: UDP-N-acetylglucosamine 2-epimerase, partial [Bacteroidales bacterium]|nr:UDP-N-acetylglucosamine 2-epimerase [Bacteroidales bacterium]
PAIFFSGDVMYDNALYYSNRPDIGTNILSSYNLNPGSFVLCTVHRENNTNIPENLLSILSALVEISGTLNKEVVFPMHPRTKRVFETFPENNLPGISKIKVLPPLSYLQMISLEKEASMIFTDSGGVQKEAFFFNKPCVILREETEWLEIIKNNGGILAGANKQQIVNACHELKNYPGMDISELFGDGKAAAFIGNKLARWLL